MYLLHLLNGNLFLLLYFICAILIDVLKIVGLSAYLLVMVFNMLCYCFSKFGSLKLCFNREGQGLA